jgi:hypothetical protein
MIDLNSRAFSLEVNVARKWKGAKLVLVQFRNASEDLLRRHERCADPSTYLSLPRTSSTKSSISKPQTAMASQSMIESLPLELREHITSFLLPYFSPASRTDVYNLRLVSRSINAGAKNAFVQVIGNVPTQCTPQSLAKLESLIALVGKQHITHLAFHACRLYVTAPPLSTDLIKITEEARDRRTWSGDSLEDELINILRETSRLKHLSIVSETVCWLGADTSRPYDFQPTVEFEGVYEVAAAEVPDPLKASALRNLTNRTNMAVQCIQQALVQKTFQPPSNL